MIRFGAHQNQGKRKEQQDSFGFYDSKDAEFEKHAGKLAIVADGMGGLAQGKDASEMAIKKFIESYSHKKPEESVSVALLRALHYSNARVFEYSESQGKDGKIGTTLVAAVIKDNELFWISVGDSRIYLLQQDQISLLTTDHSYETRLEELYAQGKIEKEDAESHPQKASLTSYIGSEEIEYIARNTSPLKIFPNDKVLLCSDGLYSRFKNNDFVSIIGADPTQSCKNLVEEKLKLNIKSQDNLTAAILQKGGSGKIAKNTQSNNTLLFVFVAIAAIVGYMLLGNKQDEMNSQPSLSIGDPVDKVEELNDKTSSIDNLDKTSIQENKIDVLKEEVQEVENSFVEMETQDKDTSFEEETNSDITLIDEKSQVNELDISEEDSEKSSKIDIDNSEDSPLIGSTLLPTEDTEIMTQDDSVEQNEILEETQVESPETVEKDSAKEPEYEIVEGDLTTEDPEEKCKFYGPDCPDGIRI